MARRRSEPFRVLVTTAVLIVVWLLLPTGIKSLLNVSFYEFQAPAWQGASHVNDLQRYWSIRAHSKQDLIEAARDLSRQNAALQIFRQKNEALKEELEFLEAALQLPPLPSHRYEIARVARRDLSTWWQYLIIRKGEDYDIPEGAAVIYNQGVVGRVKEVRATTSIVELISSRQFRMAANFENDIRPVTYQGSHNTALGSSWGEVRDVPPDIQTSKSEPRRLISSRLGGVFPQGLHIGSITSLEPDNNGLFQRGSVKLPDNIQNLKEVAVLIPISTKEGLSHDR